MKQILCVNLIPFKRYAIKHYVFLKLDRIWFGLSNFCMIKLINFQVIVRLINFISLQVAFLIFIDMLLYLNVEPSQKLAKNRPAC